MGISSPAFPEKYYALRYENAVVDASVGASGPDAASLAALEAVMLDAHRAYWQRRYQDGIAAYRKAASEIYALIDPQFDHRVVSSAPIPTARRSSKPSLASPPNT